jgi:methylenetetrahydrofolate reductase (NADPH)
VGVPGPAAVRRLLAYASRCGVPVRAPVAREYGFSLTEPVGTAGPERFIRTLAAGYNRRLHGEVRLHFNTFGGFMATAEWINRFRGPHQHPTGPGGPSPLHRAVPPDPRS